MKSGYEIRWSDHALEELAQTIHYLEENWTEREIRKFSRQLDHTLQLISRNPELFQASNEKREVRRAVVATYNNLYYRISGEVVQILSLFSNRQNPSRKKI